MCAVLFNIPSKLVHIGKFVHTSIFMIYIDTLHPQWNTKCITLYVEDLSMFKIIGVVIQFYYSETHSLALIFTRT